VAIYPIEIASYSFAMTFMNSIRLNLTWYQKFDRYFQHPQKKFHTPDLTFSVYQLIFYKESLYFSLRFKKRGLLQTDLLLPPIYVLYLLTPQSYMVFLSLTHLNEAIKHIAKRIKKPTTKNLISKDVFRIT